MAAGRATMVWQAGIRFGLFAFGFGFLLGTIRTLVIAPTLGPATAVVLELPVMLLACWWWAGRIVARYVPASREAALAIGLIGFAVLMIGEFAVGLGLMGFTPSEWIANFHNPEAQFGLMAQLLTIAMPLQRARRLPRG